MPQKSLFSRPPLLSLQQSFPSPGLVRTGDEAVRRLYRNALAYSDNPACWEGLFRLACLVTDQPADCPVYAKITACLGDSESGAIEGNAEEQIAKARAAFALFEYNTDRSILRRLGKWFRYMEIEWNTVFCTGSVGFSPADLMELLVRFYRASGMKAVLRLCSRLRTDAFDWTTALHTVQQGIPFRFEGEDPLYEILRKRKDEIEYDEKEILLNHAEMLADAVRYAHFSGEFSGNGQDLSAGRYAWSFLSKHHRAACGGTTGTPYLAGASPASPVDTRVLCAWTEAFACSLALPDTLWAADELVRIVFNGLSACLRQETTPAYQLVNCLRPETVPNGGADTCARITRAVDAAFRHAVGLTEEGVRINYLLPARYAVMSAGRQAVISSDGQKAVIRIPSGGAVPAGLFLASTETAEPLLLHGNETKYIESPAGAAKLVRLPEPVRNEDILSFSADGEVRTENAHHRGITCWLRNRLLCAPVQEGGYAYAMDQSPSLHEGVPEACLRETHAWKLREGEPEDIPVLPHCGENTRCATLVSYDHAGARIALFPKAHDS